MGCLEVSPQSQYQAFPLTYAVLLSQRGLSLSGSSSEELTLRDRLLFNGLMHCFGSILELGSSWSALRLPLIIYKYRAATSWSSTSRLFLLPFSYHISSYLPFLQRKSTQAWSQNTTHILSRPDMEAIRQRGLRLLSTKISMKMMKMPRKERHCFVEIDREPSTPAMEATLGQSRGAVTAMITITTTLPRGIQSHIGMSNLGVGNFHPGPGSSSLSFLLRRS